jgi:hypothetical protein
VSLIIPFDGILFSKRLFLENDKVSPKFVKINLQVVSTIFQFSINRKQLEIYRITKKFALQPI